LGKRPDYLWFTVFDEHGDHARLAVLAALFGAIDRAPYRSNFAPVIPDPRKRDSSAIPKSSRF
jgi:hypothetical protein